MTKTLTITAIITATVLVVGSLYIGSNVLAPVEAISDGTFPGEGSAACLPENVKHWDKIIFKSKKDILNAAGVVIFDKNAIMDIKVLDDPTKIEFPMQKAADRLNLPGWTTDKGDPFTPGDLKLIDIEYAIVCVTTGLSNGGT